MRKFRIFEINRNKAVSREVAKQLFAASFTAICSNGHLVDGLIHGYCGICGAKIMVPKPARCPKCRHLDVGADYCQSCGHKLVQGG